MFPSPTGVTYYEYTLDYLNLIPSLFPSPTGVTYYESLYAYYEGDELKAGFRPQQGLLIMNCFQSEIFESEYNDYGFRPQQGLLIMNLNRK